MVHADIDSAIGDNKHGKKMRLQTLKWEQSCCTQTHITCNCWLAKGLNASSSSRVNQEKMKHHRETILPPSPTKDPSPAPKGRVAATNTQGGYSHAVHVLTRKHFHVLCKIIFLFPMVAFYVYLLKCKLFVSGCRWTSLWTKWHRVTWKAGPAHWEGCGECFHPQTSVITLHRSFDCIIMLYSSC